MQTGPTRRVLQASVAWALLASISQAAGRDAEWELASCVAGSPALRVPAAAERAALDATDRRRFHAAAQARYPLYQRSGQAPGEVILLRRGGQWQYLTLWPGGATGPCVSAVFAADRFPFTRDWIARYRPRAPEAAD